MTRCIIHDTNLEKSDRREALAHAFHLQNCLINSNISNNSQVSPYELTIRHQPTKTIRINWLCDNNKRYAWETRQQGQLNPCIWVSFRIRKVLGCIKNSATDLWDTNTIQ